MATFNPDQAIDFGAIMLVLGPNFEPVPVMPGQPDLPAPVSAYNYSYGTVFNPVVNGQPSAQTGPNVQAALNLFSDPNSLSDIYLSLNGSSEQLTATISTNIYDTSTMVLASEPLATGSYNVNLSTATLVSNSSSVIASSSLTFVFIPGTTQSQTLSYSTGTTISEATTNGITNTTTNTEGTTVTVSETVGTSVTGGVPGDSGTVSDSVTESINEAWTESTSQSTNYSTTSTNQTNTTITSTTTVNLNTATENPDGTYTYGTYTLIPGNEYIVEIQLSQATYSNPVSQTFQIYGPDSSTTLEFNVTESDPDAMIIYEVSTNADPVDNIYSANYWGYSLLSGIDSSLFQYQSGSTDMVLYSGLVTATSIGSADATVVIQAVANTTTADNSGATVSGAADGVPMLANSLSTSSNAMLDLELAASRLHAGNGVYFNTATPGVENNLIAQYLSGDADGLISLNGGNQDTAILGDLNYVLTGFTNSNVTVGNGSNQIVIDSAENGNRFLLGNGNNSISLDGQNNNLYIGDGVNYVEVTGGTGKNYIIDGTGSTALMINSEIGFTQVSQWDQTKDTLHFGSNLNLSDVEVTFNYNDWSYNVYVKDHLVANLLTVGGLSLSDPTTTITSSAAYAPTAAAIETDQGFLTGLYADAFTRAPDAAGLLFWTEELGAGVSRNAVIQDFLVSSEYDLAHLSSSEYVNGLYKDILGRQEDAAGSTFWIDQLDSGASRVAVVGAFLGSAEYNNLI